jgi:hypothetical protein
MRIVHLWDYIEFADEVNAKIIEQSYNHNLIDYVVLCFSANVDESIFFSYKFSYCLLTD